MFYNIISFSNRIKYNEQKIKLHDEILKNVDFCNFINGGIVVMMEIRDLFDVNRNLTGETICKGEDIPKGKYIAVVLCFIQNSDGNFLIQKRSKQKNGKYGSTSGHLETGETSLHGMLREIKEELGLEIRPTELELINSGRDDSEQFFFDIYYLKKDCNLDDLILQKEEVDFAQWNSLEQIQELINKDLFSPSHTKIFLNLKEILRKK